MVKLSTTFLFTLLSGLQKHVTVANNSCTNTDCEDPDSCITGLYIFNHGETKTEVGCEWLKTYPNYCDKIVSPEEPHFYPNEMCCACGGGQKDGPTLPPTPPPTSPPSVSSTCYDDNQECATGLYLANHGETEIEVDCDWLKDDPKYCDDIVSRDDTFYPSEMCCVCGGGSWIPDAEQPPAVPDCSGGGGGNCKDSEEFRWQNKEKRTCGHFLNENPRQNSSNKIKKRCSKKQGGVLVYDWCPESCGKVGLGSCAQ